MNAKGKVGTGMSSTDRSVRDGMGDGASSFTECKDSPIGDHVADQLLTESRQTKYKQVIARRTRRLVVVVEDCYDPHNATAIMRTCDSFGVQEVHVTTARNTFRINSRISQGTHKYIDLFVYPHIEDAYAALRERGYTILVTDLRAESIKDLRIVKEKLDEQPLAIVFGSEAKGVSQVATDRADGHFLIPMSGFTESMNVSVAVAVTVHALRQDALNTDAPGDLSAEEQTALYEKWVRAHKGKAAAVLLDGKILQPSSGEDRSGEPLDEYSA